MKWLRDHLLKVVTAAMVGALATWLTVFLTPLIPSPEQVWNTFESIWEKRPPASEVFEAKMAARGCNLDLFGSLMSKIANQAGDILGDFNLPSNATSKTANQVRGDAMHKLMDDWLSQAGCSHRDLNEMFEFLDLTRSPVIAYLIGQMYVSGSSYLVADPRRGFGLIKGAAEQGSASAQITLADLYLKGLSTPPSKSRALAWCWLYNTARFHRVYEERDFPIDFRRNCGKFVGDTSDEEHRLASRLFDKLYPTSRSTGDGFL